MKTDDCILLRGPRGDEILFLRTPVGGIWYRQSRSKRQNRYGHTIYSIGQHDPAFQLKTGHLKSELALYAQKGYLVG